MRTILNAIGFGIACLVVFTVMWARYLYLVSEVSQFSLNAEGAFYYSYFERIVQSSTIHESISRIVVDTESQGGSVINALTTYPVLYELGVGMVYRIVRHIVPIDPFYFYVSITFLTLSISIVLTAFIIWKKERTILPIVLLTLFVLANERFMKVGMRENNAIFPFFISLFTIATLLERKKSNAKQIVILVLSTCVTLSTWQFSRYLYGGVACIIFVLALMRQVSKRIGGIALICIILLFVSVGIGDFSSEAIINYGVSFFGRTSFDASLYRDCSGNHFQPISNILLLIVYLLAGIGSFIYIIFIRIKKTAGMLFIVSSTLFIMLIALLGQRFYVLYLPMLAIVITLFSKYSLKIVLTVLASLILVGSAGTNQNFTEVDSKKKVVQWITNTIHKQATFAGSMDITSQLGNHTRFRTVNPVFYETQYSQRAHKDVYGVYAYTDPQSYRNTLRLYNTSHLIIERSFCERSACDLAQYYPAITQTKLCTTLVTQCVSYFKLLYYNDRYAVFEVL